MPSGTAFDVVSCNIYMTMTDHIFWKKIGIKFLFCFVLISMTLGTYVYADKYTWTSRQVDINPGEWQAVSFVKGSEGVVFAGRQNVIYKSLDNGSTWELVQALDSSTIVRSIATSDNGLYVLVSTNNSNLNDDGRVYLSSTSGNNSTFQDVGLSPEDWGQAAMSADGTYMYVTSPDTDSVAVSTNAGFSWGHNDAPDEVNAIGTSNSGQIVVVGSINANVYKSGDYANIFEANTPSVSVPTSIAVTADGSIAAVAVSGGYPVLYDVINNTVTEIVSIPQGNYSAADMSDDGQRIVFVQQNGKVYASNDGGTTFTEDFLGLSQTWNGVSIDSAGHFLFLASSDAYIYSGLYDTAAPTITNITSSTANGTYKVGQNIVINVTFSEPIYNSEAAETPITLTFETGTVDRTCQVVVSNGQNSGSCAYVVQSGDISSDLSTTNITGTISDEVGNTNSSHSGALAYLASNKNLVIDGSVPSVSITSPLAGSYASGTVPITATASDLGTGLVGVQFKYFISSFVDIGAEDTSEPYSVNWDTSALGPTNSAIYAVARDVAGNYSTSTVNPIIIDNVPPAAPVSAPDLTTASDTGTSTTDNITSSTTPQFSVPCVFGTTLRLYRAGSTLLGTSAQCSSGSPITITSTTIPEGTHSLTLTATDQAGNVSTSSSPALSLTVDTSAPSISLTAPIDGSSASGTVALVATASDSVSSVTGVQFRNVTDAADIGSLDETSPYGVSWDSTAVSDGSVTLRATATDIAGNSASSTISVNVDNTAPSAPTSLDLLTASDLGTSNSDDITSLVTPQFSAACETGATVNFYRGGSTLIGSGTCSSSTVTITSATLTDGSYTITAIQTDAAGNVSSASGGLAVTIDTSASSTPSPSSTPAQSTGPTAVSSMPTNPIPGIYNPNTISGGTSSVAATNATNKVQAVGVASGFRFVKNATVKTVNNEVANLQRMLNILGFKVATSGAGSKGEETSFFGPKTKLALIRFQRAFDVPTTGFFGPLSRAAMNNILKSISK